MSDPYEREAAKAAIKTLQRELAEARADRDRIAIDVFCHRHELAETSKDYECLAQLLDGHDATECRMNLVQIIQQRDGAFSLIDYAGELLGVTPQEHKSAHGFKVLQSLKDLIETNRQLTASKEGQP